MKTPEGKLKDEIKAFLKAHNCYQYWPVPSGYGTQTVDCLGCYKGFFFAIETKAPGKKPTPRQELSIRWIRDAGGYACWFDDWGIAEHQLREWVNLIDKKHEFLA